MSDSEIAKYEVEERPKSKEVKEQSISQEDIQTQITSLIPLAGTIELTKEQEEVLYAPVIEAQVEIRPDGLIYLPWMEYVTRLRKAFGMSWTLIPYGNPKKVGNFIHWAFWLIIKGKPYGFAVGEQQYFDNERMTYGDALEGAKSNALMRLCKGLGISLELWQPEFRRKWLPKYSETYPATYPDGKPILDKHGKQKIYWRKKGQPNGIQEERQGLEDKKPPLKEPQKKNGEIPPPVATPDVQKSITTIEDVRLSSGIFKDGKNKGQSWNMCVVLGGDKINYRTYHKSHEDLVMKEKGTGLPIAIEWKQGKYGREIVNMEVAEREPGGDDK